jgi:hypothetical protein
MWRFAEEPWQYRVLDCLPSGIDHAQLERMRKRTPSERLDEVVALMEFGAELQDALAKARSRR